MRRIHLGAVSAFLLAGALGLPACQQKQAPAEKTPTSSQKIIEFRDIEKQLPKPLDTRPADQEAIRAASRAWSQAAMAKDLAKSVSYYAEDAQMFPPHAPLVTGADAIRATWAGLLAAPGPGLSFESTKVEASRAGDLAYETGVYTFTTLDTRGRPNIEKGKYVVVWKKQADGSWKAVADIWNPDK
jgi:uncharacterized protein (TIGR02246 family)